VNVPNAHRSKYWRLGKYLEKSEKSVETITYQRIEKILRFVLPKSAYKYKPWWYGARPHTTVWIEVGWKFISLNVGKSVTFMRVR